MAHAHAHDPDKYYIPHGSNLPFFGSVSLFILMAGAALFLSGVSGSGWILTAGLVLVFALFYLWFGKVIEENQAGLYNMHVDRSFRMGMMWFIFSEVMFFAAFFGALFYARQISMPWLGGEGAKAITSILHPGYEGIWPYGGTGPDRLGPNAGGEFEVMPAWGLPAINTALLLTSGVTLTIAHHALKDNKRGILNLFLALTFILGFIFLGVQAYVYHHAWTELGLQLGTGVYGSTFFMLTGFHGLHVIIGVVWLICVWIAAVRGKYTAQNNLGVELAGLYWHFVDLVWILVFTFIYLL